MTTTPFKYQIEGLKFIESTNGRTLLADEMGLGKGMQSLMYLDAHPEITRCVVVCPASLKYNWQNECNKHFGIRSEVLGSTKVPNRLPRARVLVINYDVLNKWVWALKDLNPQLIILDECHYLAGKSTQRTRAAKILCQNIPHVIAVSGTPMLNRPIELYPTLNILYPNEFGSYHAYCHRYCGPRKCPWAWTFTGASHVKELNGKLSKFMIRRKKVDVMKELPPLTYSVVPVPIKSKKEYDKADKGFMSWVKKNNPEKSDVTARAEGLVKAGHLKRLAAKLKLDSVCKWVDDFLAGTDEKLILFAVHKSIISHLVNRYKKLCVKVDGSVPSSKRQEAFDKFKNVAKCRLFIGNIKAAGVGWNGQFCRNVVFAEMGWTPGEHIQAAARAHRIGSKNAVSVYFLVAKETIEEKLCRVIQRKQEVLNDVIDGGNAESLSIYTELCKEMLKDSL